jgi:hypothetical protein
MKTCDRSNELMADAPELDPLGRDFARLAFGIERHVPGFIDAWLGADEMRAALEPAASPPPAALVADARELLDRIAVTPLPERRRDYLTGQVEAMLATARRLAGEEIPYREEVRLLFDIEPAATPERDFETAIAALDRLLPGDGSVPARMTAWRERYVISPKVARQLVDRILPELRERTAELVELPAGESIEIAMVQDKPWSGYNWYLGGARSRVELNTDLPIHASRLTELLAHEGYPGHHTEHTLKERLYTEEGLGEHALQLINTPECIISEGIATLAEGMIFSPEELARFRRERVYPAAGIAGDPEREIAIAEARKALTPVAGNAALLLHEEGQSPEEVVAYLRRYGLATEPEARQRLRFIADPLWRAYIFTYHVGHDLLGRWIDGGGPGERGQRFRRLLTEQVTPSRIAAWSRAEAGAATA